MADTLADKMAEFRREVEGFPTDDPATALAVTTVLEAITAVTEGNAGIGALLVDPGGEVVAIDRNRMFTPRFRSDFHAEMVLLTNWEDAHPDTELKGYTLVTSLEPCEMCNIRIINSGVSKVRWVAEDVGKGAINGPNRLADHWQVLADGQDFGRLDCLPRLAEISLEVFHLARPGVTERLMARRIYPDGGP